MRTRTCSYRIGKLHAKRDCERGDYQFVFQWFLWTPFGLHMRLAVLLTCHNRAAQTLLCLQRLRAAINCVSVDVMIYLVDDGSVDGTTQTVAANFPEVEIIPADGSLYWGGGMRLAYHQAKRQNFDAYLWLNDDVILFDSALTNILNMYRDYERSTGYQAVITGWTIDERTRTPTYGGLISKSKLFPLRLTLAATSGAKDICSTMNGNVVLIPSLVYSTVGDIDPEFPHLMGDIDFGFRVTQAGIPILSCSNSAGTCGWNEPSDGQRRLSLADRIKTAVGVKRFPLRAWLKFTRRHGGVLWPAAFISPYLKAVLGVIK
jgi:GT2 family glycosyltransferase